ncbi:MAG: D-mannonate epimerase [Lentisphaerae bacterium RIFOXYB12_FULL_65_16]|nr:MAG: D-mannonate epimerase [Lentisphaerae bacterium RIFOXYA12_64_32]OGV92187.1 MAG: D-mannonate epimerase [Lentisphaerae bacterium RIFOXYB12_FULL_65_16]
MATLAKKLGETLALTAPEKRELLEAALQRLGRPLRKVLILPPDFTRFNSNAGELTAILYDMLSPQAQVDIMPALGTHFAMAEGEIRKMFGPNIPLQQFKVHDWRNGVEHMGDISGERLKEWSEGKVNYSVRVEIDRILRQNYDLILSVGQIVPHEVVGMANYTKNILVGVGGQDTINKSHFLGAVYNMERIMGRIDTPVRRLFNYGVEAFLGDLPILYVLTVMSKDKASGKMAMRGLLVGDDMATFAEGARLSQKVNLDLMDRPLSKVVVYLDPHEFKSTWLGNKAVYRTRMAIADKGELVVLAPGLREFGEDPEIDRLIRKYGYYGTPATLGAVRDNADLQANLSAAAHLIHGSSEGRFRITYCPGPGLSRDAIRGVGFNDGDLAQMTARYNPDKLKDGLNRLPDGEEIFYISNPALGLWALKKNFAGG